MKRLLALLGLIELVWTEDFNGSIRLRMVHKTPFGKRLVYGIGGKVVGTVGELRDDGTIAGRSYMERWKPWRAK